MDDVSSPRGARKTEGGTVRTWVGLDWSIAGSGIIKGRLSFRAAQFHHLLPLLFSHPLSGPLSDDFHQASWWLAAMRNGDLHVKTRKIPPCFFMAYWYLCSRTLLVWNCNICHSLGEDLESKQRDPWEIWQKSEFVFVSLQSAIWVIKICLSFL